MSQDKEAMILQMENAAVELRPLSYRVFTRLLALGIRMGTTHIEVSDRQLYKYVPISTRGLAKAKREMARYIQIEVSDRQRTRFVLPLDWLTPQQPLFISTTALPERADCTPPACSPAIQQRADCTPPASTVHAASVQIARQERAGATGNQQLTGDSGRSDQISPLGNRSIQEEMINLIVRTKTLPEELLEQSSVLSEHLRGYARQYGPKGLSDHPVPEIILARCLVIAPLDDLILLLRQMHRDPDRFEKSYAWFVTTFANKIHNVDAKELSKAYSRKDPTARYANPQFTKGLVNQVSQKHRKAG